MSEYYKPQANLYLGGEKIMFRKVLILSAAVGGGHLRAAEALEKAILQENAAREVKNIDDLNFTNPLFRRLYEKAYLEMVNSMPEVLGWMYDSLDKPWENERRRLALDRLNTQPLVKFLKNYEPDIAVCPPFLPAEIISWLKAKGKIAFRRRSSSRISTRTRCGSVVISSIISSRSKKRASISKNWEFPPEKSRFRAFRLIRFFAETEDKRAMREKYGLENDKLTILVSAGGFGVGKIEHLLGALADLQTPAQILAVCGRNEELKTKLEKLAREKLNTECVKFKPVGFTAAMDE